MWSFPRIQGGHVMAVEPIKRLSFCILCSHALPMKRPDICKENWEWITWYSSNSNSSFLLVAPQWDSSPMVSVTKYENHKHWYRFAVANIVIHSSSGMRFAFRNLTVCLVHHKAIRPKLTLRIFNSHKKGMCCCADNGPAITANLFQISIAFVSLI
jgi:hypothetical protein